VKYTIICISATDGADARQVADAIGKALNFRVIDEEIVARAAAEAGVDEQSIASVEERKTAVTKIIDRMVVPGAATDPDFVQSRDVQITAGMIGFVLPRSPGTRRPSDELRGLIRSAIDEFMAAGNVVIFAHAASQSLAGRQGVLRLLVTASPQTRSARLAESLQISTKEAEGLVKRGDGNRADYFKRFYKIDNELPTHYDIVVNTDNLAPAVAASAVVALATAADAE